MYKKSSGFLIALVLVTSFLPSVVFAARGTQQTPKLMNFFIGYLITDEDVQNLAKWDIVVLDMDQQFQFPEKVRALRRLNPDLKILAYVSASEIADARFVGDQTSPGYKLAQSIPESWFMHHPDGSRANWWPQTSLLNATDLGPTFNGQRWNTFLGPFIQENLMSSGLWDGVFLDAAYGDLTTTFGPNLDPDLNGLVNPAKQTDQAWQEGMKKLMRNVRSAIGSDKLILNNSSSIYASLTNGTLFENFPRYGWVWPFIDFRASYGRNVSPKITAINTNTNDQVNPTRYQTMRYGLASTLLVNGYYSFDAGPSNHHQTWWYDEYNVALGDPRSEATVVKGSPLQITPAVWQRSYDKGLVLVNSTKLPQTISLPGEFERLTGEQDPVTNNGAVIAQATIPPEDGLILLRRANSFSIRGAAYANGTFFQVYHADGSRARNGFFASRSDVTGGATVLTEDLDRDGKEDVVITAQGKVTVRLSARGSNSFYPYGKNYDGDLHVTIRRSPDPTSKKFDPFELVLTPLSQIPARILVTDLKGAVRQSFLAYRKEFTGGATVSTGDLDGDGTEEIVTGAGSGGGPHVRLFTREGRLWGGSFFAFDPHETGGVHLAVGDLDGDGREEIVVGSGKGTLPRI
ncbi:hypothetical protein EXS71_04130, partial [Candidatus Uhrbacteria bacterium]|nr:hypothetical protein [Candidatus Uhrbacteria bacterium]